MSPKVSVIMSVCDGQAYLQEAVRSVLTQSFQDFEFLIVDDGSSDETLKILKSIQDQRVQLFCHPESKGLTKSLNFLLGQAKGKYIARQDADDISYPHRLEKQVRFLDQNQDIGLVGSAYDVIDEKGETMATHYQPTSDTEIRWQIFFHNAFCHASVLFRSDLVSKNSLTYDEHFPFSQDYDLWTRFLRVTKAKNFSEPLVQFRTHNKSLSVIKKESQQKAADMISGRNLLEDFPEECLSNEIVQQARQCFYQNPNLIRMNPLVRNLYQKLYQNFHAKYFYDTESIQRIYGRWIQPVDERSESIASIR